MMLTDPFVLPEGALLVPVSELPETLRAALPTDEGDFALSRPHSRANSKVIDRDGAALLAEFSEPTTIAAAVARFSRNKPVDAGSLLESALPMLTSLIAEGLLVPADSAGRTSPATPPIREVNGWRIEHRVQLLEDTEVCLARDAGGRFGALKLCGPGLPAARAALRNEARILKQLDGKVTPALLELDECDGRAYIVTEWFAGTHAQAVCAEYRDGSVEGRRELLRITAEILRSYGDLHDAGIVHGDIHPRNILIDRQCKVKIVDLGLAHAETENSSGMPGRAGIGFFLEPEFATAIRAGKLPPPVTFLGEQYALAALLYLLIAGSHYLDFCLEKNEMLRQISEDPPVPFARRGIPAWPDAERLLVKALSKDAGQRVRTVRELAAAWECIRIPPARRPTRSATLEKIERIRQGFIANYAVDARVAQQTSLASPSASVMYGSAGIACALHRISSASDDGEMFALADSWLTRAVRDLEDSRAFYDPALDVAPNNVGAWSLYHGPAGVYVVGALIAHARGDAHSRDTAIHHFIDICRKPCAIADLVLGRAGTLLGCALLLEKHRSKALYVAGDDLLAELWRDSASLSSLGEFESADIGMAHGLAGLLYASLIWCIVADRDVPPAVLARLRQMTGYGLPLGRGLWWRSNLGEPDDTQVWGWCNGSAGFVFLWTAAYRATADKTYLELAEAAAWNVWEMPAWSHGLCCGTSGQSYALLNFYRRCGDPVWLRRARDRANFAQPSTWRPYSLYKGDAGIAVLSADIKRPDDARMPMFECDYEPARSSD